MLFFLQNLKISILQVKVSRVAKYVCAAGCCTAGRVWETLKQIHNEDQNNYNDDNNNNNNSNDDVADDDADGDDVPAKVRVFGHIGMGSFRRIHHHTCNQIW